MIFDFDGTMVDSEMPIYRDAARALAEAGLELTVPGWATVVGHGEDDSYEAMCTAVGARFDRAAFEARVGGYDRGWHDELPALPGVEGLLAELAAAGVPCGVASSSSSGWVDRHLERLGLAPRFAVVATRDRVGGRTKPDPASYRWALEQLGADPGRSVAIEDSAPGIAAARAAGLAVLAIPSEITRHTDLSAATATVAALTEVDLRLLAALALAPGSAAAGAAPRP